MEIDNHNDRVANPYFEYLPNTLRNDKILGSFIRSFECILSRNNESKDPNKQKGLEEYINIIHTYFSPGTTSKDAEVAPKEFLPWLASWVALSLQDDWDEDFKREFISQVVPLYMKRGTKEGIEKLLRLYTQNEVKIYEFEQPVHYFQVELIISEENKKELRRKENIAKNLLDMEKPAHTFYALKVQNPMRKEQGRKLK